MAKIDSYVKEFESTNVRLIMVIFEILHFFKINNQGNPSKQKGITTESGYKTQPSTTKMIQIQQKARLKKKIRRLTVKNT